MAINGSTSTGDSTWNSTSSSGTTTVNIDGLFSTTDNTGGSGIGSILGAIFRNNTSTALFTLLVLVVIILGAGGKVFGGYGNYPGYGGYSVFGFTPAPFKRYKYNPYDIYEDAFED